jgi:hypothetical protein
MLDPIIRALVGVPPEWLGIILDVINKVGGVDDERWRSHLATILREPIPLLDTIIRVDRSIQPIYPDRMSVLHPELEQTGPLEYYLVSVVLWLHEGQKNGNNWSSTIYEYLKEKKMLESCLSLHDGEEIQKKGIAVFRRFFQGKKVILWKSIVKYRGDHYVPYLAEDRDAEVVLAWMQLEHTCFDSKRPALLFVSQASQTL